MNNQMFLAFNTNKMKQLYKSLTKSETKLFLVISSYLPRAYPSISTLCSEADMARNTVFKCLKSMELKGVLKRYKRNGLSNIYLISESLFRFKRFFEKSLKCVEKLLDEYNKKFYKKDQYQISKYLPVPISNTQSNNININKTFFTKNFSKRAKTPTHIGSIFNFT